MTDLRALIQDRKSKDVRATVKVQVCLDPDLLPELNEALAERDSRGDETDPDQRLGKTDPLVKRIRDLEVQVAEVSVTAVFKTPTRAKYAAEYLPAIQEDDPDVEATILSECFSHFEKDGLRLPDTELGVEDWQALVPLTAPGEVSLMAGRIVQRTVGSPDFPKSLQRSSPIRK